jgi:hypothetical protein
MDILNSGSDSDGDDAEGTFAEEFEEDFVSRLDTSEVQEPEQPESRFLDDGDEYRCQITERMQAGGKEIAARTVDGDLIAGKHVRETIESARNDPDKPFPFAYDDSGHQGFDPIQFSKDAMRAHGWVSGTTKAGKTTLKQNKCVYHAYAGHGITWIDPKADGDTIELLQKIPSHRLDDVVYIEPGASDYDRNIGVNMLDMPPVDDPRDREKVIEGRLNNLKAIFQSKNMTWGATMESVLSSMGRAMLKYNAEVAVDPDRDPSEKYSIIDMFFILLNEQRREDFAAEAPSWLTPGLEMAAEMEDEKLFALFKRVKRWVENGVIRKIVAERDSSIDWDEIVDDEKILIVRLPVNDEDIHQMVTLTVLRSLWTAKRRQSRDPDRETIPHFLHVDEFRQVASDSLDMSDMLVLARSFWLSITLGTQYPMQIGKHHEDTLLAMNNNCNQTIAMRTPGEKDAKILMSKFDGYDASDLQSLDYWRCFTKMQFGDGKEGSPTNGQNFAPMPNLRSEEEAREVIQESLERHGTHIITERQIQKELKFGQIGDIANPASSFEGEVPEELSNDPEMILDIIPEQSFLESIYAAQLRHADVETPVAKSLVEEELEKRVGDVGFSSEISNAFEKNDLVKNCGMRDGELHVRLTDDGLNSVLSHDTGSAANAGGDYHRHILYLSYQAFTELGAVTSLPQQEGKELPDGLADLPFDPMEKADNANEVVELRDKLAEDHPELWDLSNGRHISIEAETSTLQKPMQTLTNLRKAVESGRTCVFACKDATADDTESHGIRHWPRRAEKVVYDTDGDTIDYDTITCVNETFDTGERHFYNRTRSLKINRNKTVVAPAHEDHNELVWRERGDAVVAISKRSGSEDAELKQFSSVEIAVDPPADSTLHREKINDQWVVKRGEGDEAEVEATYDEKDALQEDWMDLYEPFIPEIEFPREVEEDDFEIVVFPDEDNPDYDRAQVYSHNRLDPLFEDDTVLDRDEIPTDAENQETAAGDVDAGEGGDGHREDAGDEDRDGDHEDRHSRPDDAGDGRRQDDDGDREADVDDEQPDRRDPEPPADDQDGAAGDEEPASASEPEESPTDPDDELAELREHREAVSSALSAVDGDPDPDSPTDDAGAENGTEPESHPFEESTVNCKECGAGDSFEEDETGVLTCDECGFQPDPMVREEIRKLLQEAESEHVDTESDGDTASEDDATGSSSSDGDDDSPELRSL